MATTLPSRVLRRALPSLSSRRVGATSTLPRLRRLPTPPAVRTLSTTARLLRPPSAASASKRSPSASHDSISHTASSAHLLGACPNCHAPFSSTLPICASCGSIHALPADVNYFALFSLPASAEDGAFEVDLRELRAKFLQMQRSCHPDAWGSKGELERRRAEELSSVLNSAYKTLQSPLLRAQYLLTLNGHPPLETDALDEASSALLLEVLETRESLESASTPQELEDIRSANDERVKETVAELSEAFAQKDWGTAKDAAVRLRYWVGIEDAVREKMRASG